MYKTFKIGPAFTPKPIKVILGIIISLSIIVAVLSPHMPYLLYFLGLSLRGISKFFIWQLVSYFFFLPARFISINFIFHLIFEIYLIWLVGTYICEWKGIKNFLAFYFSSGILVGLFTLGLMKWLEPLYLLAGPGTTIYSLLMAWLMLNPYSKIMLFFAIPISAKTLILISISISFLIFLSNGDFILFFAALFSSFYGYLFPLIAWGIKSPFRFLEKFERKIIYLRPSFFKKFSK